ncbi:MAG: hypothetical protein CM15mP12_7770 [Gammaproteobacteria bacterium]|nr:MAG: hypothetical protein CM15mP12_7770 [Gammaproteobacteria bacterium]
MKESLHNGYHIGLGNLIKMDKPVFAAVEGPCAGIGCAFLLSCDVVVMNKSSFFQVGFSKIALILMVALTGYLHEQLATKAFAWLPRLRGLVQMSVLMLVFALKLLKMVRHLKKLLS